MLSAGGQQRCSDPGAADPGVTLTGWQQTGPGHWRFAFEAPADVPELVLCLSTRSLDAVPEGLEPTDQRGEAFWVRPVPGRTSEITVTSTTVPQMWLMLPDTLWHWRELRSSLQQMALVAFASMGAGILALFCFKPKHELGVFLLYLGVMFGWGLAVLLPAGQTGALLGFLMGLYFPFAVLTPLWLCCSLLHVALPRRGSRHFALSVLGVLLFLVLGTSTQAVLRSVTLLAGMAAVLVVLARALAKKRAPGLVSAGRLHPDLWPASDGRTAILPVLVLPGKFPLLHGALCPAVRHSLYTGVSGVCQPPLRTAI